MGEIMFLLGHRQDSRALYCNRILVRCTVVPITTQPRGPIITLKSLFVCERRPVL